MCPSQIQEVHRTREQHDVDQNGVYSKLTVVAPDYLIH